MRIGKRSALLAALLVIVLLLFVAACASPTATPAPTVAARATAPSTSAPTAAPTATLIPANTLAPTSTAAPTPTSAPKVLKVAAIVPLSGPAVSYGYEVVRGNQILIDQINAGGGFKIGNDTYTVQLVQYDDKYDVATSVSLLQRAISQDNIKFVITLGTNLTAAMHPVANAANVVLMSFSYGGKSDINPANPLYFNYGLSPQETLSIVYPWLAKTYPDKKTIGMVLQDVAGEDATAQLMSSAATNAGLQVVAQITVSASATDYTPQATALVAKNPSLIDISDIPGAEKSALFLKQMRDLGFTGIPYFGVSGDPTTTLKNDGAAVSEGATYALSFESVQTNAFDTFKAAYAKAYGDWDSHSVTYALALPGLIAAIQKAGTTDSVAVAKAMTGLQFDTIVGTVRYGGGSFYGSDRQLLYPVPITQIRGGQVAQLGVAAIPSNY